MDRISTSTSYSSALLNIMSAQSRQATAQQQYATGKLADDLKGYASQADQITAAQSLQTRNDTYVGNNTALADRLSVQDQTLSQVATVTQNARQAVAEALATGDATALATSLQGQLNQAVAALNTQYNGKYLFAGGETSQTPVTSGATLAALAAPGGVTASFQNGSTPQQDRIDDQTRITTGFTASSVGSGLFSALSQVQSYLQTAQAANGGVPITKLSTADTTALTAILKNFDSAYSAVNDQVAQNGLLQNQVDAAQTSLKARQTALTNTLGDLTNVDQAAAATKLTLAQTALQASAQVFSSLNSTSLLNVLSSGA
jgi:flagellar hook-associated protein 3 FlgL